MTTHRSSSSSSSNSRRQISNDNSKKDIRNILIIVHVLVLVSSVHGFIHQSRPQEHDVGGGAAPWTTTSSSSSWIPSQKKRVGILSSTRTKMASAGRSSFLSSSSASSAVETEPNTNISELASQSLFPSNTMMIDPSSDIGRRIVIDVLRLSDEQYKQIVLLCTLITEWNDKINLVSRKDCNPSTVFTKHVLPSLAFRKQDEKNNIVTNNILDSSITGASSSTLQLRCIDIGTGGGFPGIPMAIAYPNIQFVLLDSIGKKLRVVQNISKQLQLNNVQIYHGRIEDVIIRNNNSNNIENQIRFDNMMDHEDSDSVVDMGYFDIATGRSVTSLPRFCAYMHHVLHPDHGHLMYWTGGDDVHEWISSSSSSLLATGDDVVDIVDVNVPNHYLVPHDGMNNIEDNDPQQEDEQENSSSSSNNNKKILVLPSSSVTKIAQESGIKVRRTNVSRNRMSAANKPKRKRQPRGAWRKKNSDEPRQRGYEDFQRYDSSTS